MSRMYPAPMRPAMGLAWIRVEIPQTISTAKRRPCEVGLGTAAGTHDDRHRDDDARDVEEYVLEGEPERYGVAGCLVGLKAEALACVVSGHGWLSMAA